jgi:hypothetical protein
VIFTVSAAGAPLSSEVLVAVALHSGLKHVGLLFQGETGLSTLMHLRGDQEVKAGPLTTDYRWTFPVLTPDELGRVQAMAWTLHELYVEDGLPYGIDPTGARLDELGLVILEEGGLGFSCASFVHAIFAAVGLPLVQLDSWRTAPAERLQADTAIQQQIVDDLRTRTSRREDWETRARAEVGTVASLHPTEIAAASALPNQPVAFREAAQAGRELEAHMRTLSP